MSAIHHLIRPLVTLSALACLTGPAQAGADWNQWRGPLRNGVLPDGPALAASWPAEGLRLLWESEAIPGNDEGGHSSPVVAGDRVYLSVVWHTDVPSETRTITDLVMRNLGYQNPNSLGKEVVAKMEADRVALDASMRGKKLEDYIDKWLADNLDKKQRMLIGGFVAGRFRKGKLAIPLEDYEKLNAKQDKPFASDAEFHQWVEAQGFADFVKQEVYGKVPPTERVATDTVICLDLKSGKTLWKADLPGEPRGRGCSSTAAIADGKVFAMGSTQLFAVDTATGKVLWKAPLPNKAPGSSPLVAEGKVIINSGKLTAYDTSTGKQLWQQPKLGGGQSSPVLWMAEKRPLVIINSRNELAAVDLNNGEIVWSTPGGGDATPAIVDDVLAVQTKNAKQGLIALKLKPTGVEPLWNFPLDVVRTQSSPIIHEGNVYLMDDGAHYCFSLSSGEVRWKQTVPSTITSPILADGKLFVMINNGNNVLMLKATPGERTELGKASVRALWCPSPTISQGRLIVRTQNSLRCYDLTEGGKLAATAAATSAPATR